MGQNIDPMDEGAYRLALPNWILSETCSKCGCKLRRSDFVEVGLYVFGAQQGEMFVRFVCPYCRHAGTYVYGDKKHSLVDLFNLTVKDLQKKKTTSIKPVKSSPITEEEHKRFRMRLDTVETVNDLMDWLRAETELKPPIKPENPPQEKDHPEGEA
jgi:hypothetical protein